MNTRRALIRGVVPWLLAALAFPAPEPAGALASAERSPHDLYSYELVWREPSGSPVDVREGIVFGAAAGRELKLDLVAPAGASAGTPNPAVIFLAGPAEDRAEPLRASPLFRSWMRTVAERGYVGLSGDSEGADPGASVATLFRFIREHSTELGIDPERLAVFAASGNVHLALPFVMSDPPPPGVVAALFFYGAAATAPTIRPDLPVFLAIAGRDSPILIADERALAASAVGVKAPWTVAEAPQSPHAFDVLDTGSGSLSVIGQALGFIDLHLGRRDAAPVEDAKRVAARGALMHLMGQEFETAHDYYNALASGPGRSDPFVWENLAIARLGSGSLIGEAVAREQLLHLDPENRANRTRYLQLALKYSQWGEIDGVLSPALSAAQHDPFALASLGLARLNLQKPAAAITPLESAIRLQPDASTYYNLACAYALTGRTDDAFVALSGAAAHGFANRKQLEEDADFASIRDDPRFGELVRTLPESAPPAD